jgi:type II restriction/modification system DNA methylase subunit YeeA
MTDTLNLEEGAEGQAEEYLFHASAEDFKKIPGSPIAYWISNLVRGTFEEAESFEHYCTPRQGLGSTNNDLFVKSWYELTFNKIGFGCLDKYSAMNSKKKWFPYSKGGGFRKWYGNDLDVVNWENDGKDIKNALIGKNPNIPRSESHYFKSGITWGLITSANFSARFTPQGGVFDVGGSKAFPSEIYLNYFLGLLNSKLSWIFLKTMNPTLNFQVGDLKKIPVSKLNEYNDLVSEVIKVVKFISTVDWNTYETSWDFTENPLIQNHIQNPPDTLSKNYQAWWNSNQETIAEMKRLEEENNRLFIEAYGLQEELTPDVPLEEITLTVNPKYRYSGNASDADLAKRFQSDTVCELISYAIGCMMGRYSLNRAGLVYAHSGNDGFAGLVNEGAYQTFPADEDGIIPITDEEWFADDATNRLVEFVKTVWSEAQLSENLSFIAESLCLHALKPKASESPLETIRRYLSNQFYKDHMRTYKKRPIYWLFSSGKQKAFECVVYLHRYNEATLSRMRTEYVIPLMGKYQAHAEQLQNQIEQAETTAQANKAKKALTTLEKKQHELTEFDEKLKNFADMRIALDLDDGVKENYGKFGDLLVDVKGITGKKA